MSWIDDLTGKTIMLDGVELPQRKILQFLQGDGAGITIVDNPATSDGLGSTDILIAGTAAESVIVDQAPTTGDSGTAYNNVGAAGPINVLLPASPVPVGTKFYLRVADAQYMRFTANTGQTIQMDAIVSASAGYIRSNYVGGSIAVEAVSSSRWFATGIQGSWSADS